MDSVYHNALRPSRSFRVMRQWLEALTLDHFFLLHEVESKILDPYAEIERKDIVLAVFICSRPAWLARMLLEGGLISTVWLSVYFFFWGLVCFNLKTEKESKKFSDYFEHHLGYPEIQHKDSTGVGRTLGGPEPWRLLVMLMKDFHFSKRAALKTSMLWAHTVWAVDADREGRIDLVSQDPGAIARRKMLIAMRNRDRQQASAERN